MPAGLQILSRPSPLCCVHSNAQRPNKKEPSRIPALAWSSVAAAGLLLGCTAEVSPDGATWFGLRGPYCPLAACVGPLHCPGCGLVRSTAATLQGQITAAWSFHPGGIVFAGLLPTALVVHLDALRRGRIHPYHRALQRAGQALFVVAVLGGWMIRYFVHD